MSGKIYFSLLLMLSAILTLGIENFSEKNIESSSFYVRKKRVIDFSLNGNKPVTIWQVPYILSIHENGYYVCGASILSAIVIITAAHCIERNLPYIVLSSSSYVHYGVRHTITKKIIHPEYDPDTFPNDLALAIITPPIDFDHSPNKRISVYTGPIRENDLYTLSGWGYAYEVTSHKLELPLQLRSISVPILSEEHCRNIYRGHVEVTDRDICTLDPLRKKCCGEGDSGSPLVFKGQLAGIFAWSSGMGLLPDAPDVYVKLSHPAYKEWIVSNVPYNPNRTYNPHHLYDPYKPRNLHHLSYPHNLYNSINRYELHLPLAIKPV